MLGDGTGVLELAVSIVGGGMISLVTSVLVSQYYAKKSEAQIKRLSDSVAHNVYAGIFLSNVRSEDEFRLAWEKDQQRILGAYLKRKGDDIGLTYEFKPDDWTDEKMEKWKRENRNWLRGSNS